MKKFVLLTALLFGAVSASQAGVRFNVGVGFPLPLPPLPGVVISQPAPVYAQAPCYAPPVYYGYNEPPVYFGFGPGYYGHGYYGHRYPRYYGHGWDHGRGGHYGGGHGHGGHR